MSSGDHFLPQSLSTQSLYISITRDVSLYSLILSLPISINPIHHNSLQYTLFYHHSFIPYSTINTVNELSTITSNKLVTSLNDIHHTSPSYHFPFSSTTHLLIPHEQRSYPFNPIPLTFPLMQQLTVHPFIHHQLNKSHHKPSQQSCNVTGSTRLAFTTLHPLKLNQRINESVAEICLLSDQ